MSLRAWESYRVVYNLVMLATGWFLSADLKPYMDEQAAFGYWGNVFLFGVVANVFFSLGPLWETYSIALRGKQFETLGRSALFALGLLFSLGSVVALSFEMTVFYGAFFKKF